MVAKIGCVGTRISYLPDLGEGLEEAELIEWCVRVGQQVNENDVLAKMETAKALVEIPSPQAGVVAMLHGQPGQAIKVGSPLVTFGVQPAAAAGDGGARKSLRKQEERADAGTVVGNLSEASTSAEHGWKSIGGRPRCGDWRANRGVDLEQSSTAQELAVESPAMMSNRQHESAKPATFSPESAPQTTKSSAPGASASSAFHFAASAARSPNTCVTASATPFITR